MKAVIKLWGSIGAGLIVEMPTGIAYSNQTGGHCCLQPSTEGAFLPIGNDEARGELLGPEPALNRYFEGPKHLGTGATSGLDLEDADFIDGVLTRFRLSGVVRVDRERLRESHEAWVRVLLLGEEDGDEAHQLFRGLGPYPRNAVLTWTNSD